jgi:hypothetical protein
MVEEEKGPDKFNRCTKKKGVHSEIGVILTLALSFHNTQT